jgi:hypothetical protein
VSVVGYGLVSTVALAHALRYRDEVVSLVTTEAPLPGTDHDECGRRALDLQWSCPRRHLSPWPRSHCDGVREIGARPTSTISSNGRSTRARPHSRTSLFAKTTP